MPTSFSPSCICCNTPDKPNLCNPLHSLLLLSRPPRCPFLVLPPTWEVLITAMHCCFLSCPSCPPPSYSLQPPFMPFVYSCPSLQGDTPDRLVNAVDYLLPFVGKTFVSHGCMWWDTFRCLPALGGGQNGKTGLLMTDP